MGELLNRRNKLFEKMEDGSCAIIHSGVAKISSEDENYDFVVNKDFFYLTNITQENSVLILVKSLGEKKTYLFVDPFSELKEKWTGKRLTLNEAGMLSDIKNVFENTTLENKISMILEEGSHNYGEITTLYLNLVPELKIADELSTREYVGTINEFFPHIKVLDIHPLISRLRMIKSPYEIECIKEAINLTNHGINEIIENMKDGVYEYQLSGIFEFYGHQHDLLELSFPTICAAGKNATVLHYPSQRDRAHDGDCVLFDLGYRYKGYCADISRTFPLNGKFSETQKNVYDAVVMCNKAVIEYAREGLTLRDLNNYASKFLENEMIKRGLMKQGDDIRQYYFHSVTHHLGLDCHDVGDYDLPLEPGNVITVEPGLYIKELGIGVRIEDDILITKDGSEVLSRSIKKESRDIEEIFAHRG